MKLSNSKWLCLLMLVASTAYSEPAKVRVCLSQYREELTSAAILVAKANGYFAEENLAVEISDAPWAVKPDMQVIREKSNINPDKKDLYVSHTGTDVAAIYALEKGDCDFLSTSFESVLLAGVDTQKMNAIAMYMYGGKYDTNLLVRFDSKAKSVKDLKGKTIRIGQIGTHLALDKILRANKMTLADVKVDNSSPDSLPTKLASADIEGVIAYSPTTPLLLANKSAKVLVENIFSAYMGPFIPHSMLVANGLMQSKSGDVYGKFIRAFKKAAVYIQANPLATVKVLNSEHIADHSSFNYNVYSPVTIEKSAAFFHVSEPYYIGQTNGYYSPAKVTESVQNFHHDLRGIGYLRKDADMKMVASLLKLNGT
ncbi:MAG: ABC transporter substrate-binding protein [Bdellovibrionales bacterium]